MTQTGPMTAMSKQMQECVNMCMATHTMCEETMSSCMSMEGGPAHMRIMRALMDCSEMTRMCADVMMRRSPLSPEMCAMCAKACDMCAEACMTMPDDPQMKRCAEACRRCAEMCRSMAGVAM
ncbi:four-helix bundle copper-binding protein [Streptomyces sp. NPDC048277]|uniref:four-helix bundle copper-binding protein n=1 Tax=Streptomyces sp. NPDC048277 TaxID=3155027 RepID=UPI0034118668